MTVTPNMSIFIPADGQTNYGASFQLGMQNVDAHNHTGGPNNGVPIPSGGIANGAVTGIKLNPNVAGTGLTYNNVTNQLDLGGLNKFYAYQTATVTNATGNGANYTVLCDNIQYNVGAGYNAGTGTFTAPVTGFYLFTGAIEVNSITAAMTQIQMRFTKTGQVLIPIIDDPHTSFGGIMGVSASIMVALTVGQTITMGVIVSNGVGNTAGVVGNAADAVTYFAGTQII